MHVLIIHRCRNKQPDHIIGKAGVRRLGPSEQTSYAACLLPDKALDVINAYMQLPCYTHGERGRS